MIDPRLSRIRAALKEALDRTGTYKLVLLYGEALDELDDYLAEKERLANGVSTIPLGDGSLRDVALADIASLSPLLGSIPTRIVIHDEDEPREMSQTLGTEG